VSTLVIGITGPIGCGKSTVARWLTERGAVVVDADLVARDVLAPGSPETRAVIQRFGDALLRPDGSLDRGALGAIVFSNPERLRELESIVHPAVRPRILAAITAAERAGAPAVVVEAIKLVEGGLAELCDEVWLVTCHREEQLDRLIARGSSHEDARRRVDAQGDLAARLAPHATRILDTGGPLEGARSVALVAWDAAMESGHPARDADRVAREARRVSGA
jgi:dephospho-CoA kinase